MIRNVIHREWSTSKLIGRLFAVLFVSLAFVAGVAAGDEVNAGTASWLEREGGAMDRSNRLSDEELLERLQLLSWDEPFVPVPRARGATGAASAQVLFGAVAGGGGASQDLAAAKD